MTRRLIAFSLALTLGVALVGCQQPEAGMAHGHDGPPPRPAELDKLDSFIGNWTTTCDMTMNGETTKCQGAGSSSWALDNRVVISKFEFDMGEMGKMQGMEVLTWDPSAGKYRTYWFDSMGGVGEGTMRYDDKSGMWVSKGSSIDGMSGEARANSGTMKVLDSGKHEWSFKETDPWGFKTTMELKGISTKQ